MSKHSHEIRRAVPVFAALGDDVRLQIVARLCEGGPLSIVRLADGARITRQAVTKHLRVMENAGLLRSCRRGREKIWELRLEPIAGASRYLDAISNQWDRALGRLKSLVEEGED